MTLTKHFEKTLRIATRASALALWQARHIQQRLQELHAGLVVELLPLTTQGDRILDRPLAAVGGKGLFVKEIEQALIDGRADLAVHSIKDLPADMPEGLVLAATPERANPGDVLICRDPTRRFATLPAGAIVGTSSLRRASQLLAARPDLRIIPIRGNVDTRLRKVAEGVENLDASVLAAAGLERLGWQDRITEYLDFSICLPAIGQGTLGIQARSDDFDTLAFLAPLHHPPTSIALTAERALLRAMQGNCHLPLAGFAQIDPLTHTLTLHARLCAPDGSRVLKHIASSTVATEAAADMLGTQTHAALMAAGGAEILGALNTPQIDPDAPKPLKNKRVIITRSRDRRSSALSARIEALGGQPIEVASIAIVPADDLTPLRDALRSLSSTNTNTDKNQNPFDWIIFTSANAVEHTFQCLASEALDASALRRCMVAAVGPQTAQELAVREVRVDLHPPASDARAEQLLIALLAAGVGPGSRILMPAAANPTPTLPDGLRAAGAHVEVMTAYKTIAATEDRQRLQEILSQSPPGYLTFASASAVTHFAAMIQNPTVLNGWRIACIGPTTAAAATAAGLTPHITAPATSLESLADAIAQDAQQAHQHNSTDNT